jgi:hypothetical protein
VLGKKKPSTVVELVVFGGTGVETGVFFGVLSRVAKVILFNIYRISVILFPVTWRHT